MSPINQLVRDKNVEKDKIGRIFIRECRQSNSSSYSNSDDRRNLDKTDKDKSTNKNGYINNKCNCHHWFLRK